MITEEDKEIIQKIGTLYKRVSYTEGGCGTPTVQKYRYEPVNVIKAIEDHYYQKDLFTYMKYRNRPKYKKEEYITCGGGRKVSYYASNTGEYIIDDNKKYFNLANLKAKLNQKDIDDALKRIQAEYENKMKFSYDPNVNKTGSFVPDASGTFVYDTVTKEFIDIS